MQSAQFLRFAKRSHTVETDHDLEEASFQAMFPQHLREFEDLGDSGFIHADEEDVSSWQMSPRFAKAIMKRNKCWRG